MALDEATVGDEIATARMLVSSLPSAHKSEADETVRRLGESIARVNVQVQDFLSPNTTPGVFTMLVEYLQEVKTVLDALPKSRTEPSLSREQQRSLVTTLPHNLTAAARVAKNIETVERTRSGSISVDVDWLLQQVLRIQNLFDDVSAALI